MWTFIEISLGVILSFLILGVGQNLLIRFIEKYESIIFDKWMK
jgi:hypothetical protein